MATEMQKILDEYRDPAWWRTVGSMPPEQRRQFWFARERRFLLLMAAIS